MQSTDFVASTGEGRNPFYEGLFDDESPEQASARLHWARTTRDSERVATHQVEVDRDIKATNLQLLVDAALAYAAASEAYGSNQAEAAEDALSAEFEASYRAMLDLARGLKQ